MNLSYCFSINFVILISYIVVLSLACISFISNKQQDVHATRLMTATPTTATTTTSSSSSTEKQKSGSGSSSSSSTSSLAFIGNVPASTMTKTITNGISHNNKNPSSLSTIQMTHHNNNNDDTSSTKKRPSRRRPVFCTCWGCIYADVDQMPDNSLNSLLRA